MTVSDVQTRPLPELIAWLKNKPKYVDWKGLFTWAAGRLKEIREKAGVSKEEFNQRAGLYSPGCMHLESTNLWRLGLPHIIRALEVYSQLENH